MKTDELMLLSFIADGNYPRDYTEIPDKRKWYILVKWCSKGYYDYGVTLDLGWITQAGRDLLYNVQKGGK